MKKILLLIWVLSVSYLFSEEKPVITVLDLATEDVSSGEMKSIIALLSSAIFRTEKYTVIDVAQRELLLKEIEFAASDCTDEACQIEIGKQLAAEMILVGSIGKVGKKYVLSVKMLETATARTMSTADGIYPDLETMIEDVDHIAATLSGLPVKPAPLPEEEVAREKRTRVRKIAAFSFLGGGIVGAGVGGFFVYESIRYWLGPAQDAWRTYEDAPAGSDFDTLYSNYLTEHDKLKVRIFLAFGLSGAGVAMLTVSTILFLTGKAESAGGEAFAFVVTPEARGMCVSLRFSL